MTYISYVIRKHFYKRQLGGAYIMEGSPHFLFFNNPCRFRVAWRDSIFRDFVSRLYHKISVKSRRMVTFKINFKKKSEFFLKNSIVTCISNNLFVLFINKKIKRTLNQRSCTSRLMDVDEMKYQVAVYCLCLTQRKIGVRLCMQ